jgi:adenylyltransferase/sulfurtransferase
MVDLTSEEWTRYNRQIIIPEIGEDGQKKLKDAKVFLAGLGGLGSISACYMVAAGVGFLKIVDMDRVDLENLNRQIIHRTIDIGRPKTESAIEKLRELNPHCQIQPVQEEIRDGNIMDLTEDCSLILDATDNLEARRVLNRASILGNIPFVYGGVGGFNGMVTTLIPGETPCIECLFPQKTIQTDRVGILGPVPGLVASIQSLEAIKIILGMDGLLKCRLLFIRGLDMTFKEIQVEKNPNCTACNPKT